MRILILQQIGARFQGKVDLPRVVQESLREAHCGIQRGVSVGARPVCKAPPDREMEREERLLRLVGALTLALAQREAVVGLMKRGLRQLCVEINT